MSRERETRLKKAGVKIIIGISTYGGLNLRERVFGGYDKNAEEQDEIIHTCCWDGRIIEFDASSYGCDDGEPKRV